MRQEPAWLRGSCHCGAVQILVASKPAELNDCQCEHCQRRGALWAYYAGDQVTVSGPTSIYLWGPRQIEFHFCPTCGCTTHWAPVDKRRQRVGLNARVLGKAALEHIPVRRGAGPS